MKVTLYKRVKNGWEDETRDLPPEEVKTLRRTLRATLKERIAQLPASLPWHEKTAFHATPIGEYKYGSATGTLTELHRAGICGGCLGTGQGEHPAAPMFTPTYPDPCEFCHGTGDVD